MDKNLKSVGLAVTTAGRKIRPSREDYAKFQKALKLMIKEKYNCDFIHRKVLMDDLKTLINQHSMENGSNTPDFILTNFLDECLAAFYQCAKFNKKPLQAEYIVMCLKAFNKASRAREKWYGKSLHI